MNLSASTLKTWMACPLQAKFAKIDRLPQIQNGKASFGTCIHHALERYNHTGDIDLAIALFEDTWANPEKLGVVPEKWPKFTSYEGLRQRGVECLRLYHDNLRWDGREVLFTEHRFLVPFGRHTLNGVVDLGEIRVNGKGQPLLRIIDYKAQRLDTLTLTPGGWTKFGDLQVGDAVIGSDGQATKVLGVYPQGLCDVVRVHFSDGSSVECSPDHLWTVRDLYGKTRTLSVKGLNSLKKGRNHRYSVPTVNPIEYISNKLPVDPYLLGVLIGDGGLTRGGVSFTKPDPALIVRLRTCLPPGHELRVLDEGSGRCSIVGPTAGPGRNLVLNALREMGLQCRSEDKFIPTEFLFASVEDRKALLAGLMDTDGSSSNRIQFRTSSSRLRDDFVELCRSLGGVPHWSSFDSYYMNNDQRVECKESFHMTPGVPFNPFGVTTKGDGWKPPIHRQDRFIVDVEPLLEKAEMQCIKVAAEDGLYVTENFVLTHNTSTQAPTRAALALDIQFTVYLWASMQREFWEGNGPDYPGLANGGFLFELYQNMPRRAIWWHLWTGKEIDAGPRDEDDYLRLYRLACEVEKAVEREVFVPRIGDACGLCSFTKQCGIRIPSRDEDLESDEVWI